MRCVPSSDMCTAFAISSCEYKSQNSSATCSSRKRACIKLKSFGGVSASIIQILRSTSVGSFLGSENPADANALVLVYLQTQK